VSGFLKLIAVLNAGVWFGAALFATAVAAPAFLSEDMLKILPRSHAGAASQVVLERYFVLQYWCGSIALVHLLAEWLYTGKAFPRLGLYLTATLLGLALLGGLWVQPRLRRLHLEMYGVRSTPQQREAAGKSIRLWHGIASGLNFVAILGLGAYALQCSRASSAPRFVSANKFRG
jgi:hypothetical protein